MKRVLLTNAFIKEYSGSELDTIEVANYFLENDYEVDIFTLKKGDPLLKELDKKIRVITFKDIDQLYNHYDILWSHHYPLVDYLLFSTKIEFDYIHHICLSPFEAYEQPPIYYEELNMISAMSYDCKDEIIAENKLKEINNFSVFPNYAKANYFKQSKKLSQKISKIAIVSNHVPKELLETKEILEKQNIVVDIYGMGYNYVRINDKILLDYDLVISIGKTCYYSIALGIPTYIYDHFGGYGYVQKSKINEMFRGNFVCRKKSIHKTGKELAEEIIKEYSNAVSDVSYCKEFGYENFCFENNMKKTLDELLKTKKFNVKKLKEKYPLLTKIAVLFVREVGTRQDTIGILEEKGLTSCQLFYDVDGVFSEENSIREISNKINENQYEVEFELKNDCKCIRFDICEKDLVEIKDIFMNGKKINNYATNNIIEIQGNQISINNDPSIVIERKFRKDNKIKFRYILVQKQLSDVHEEYLSERNMLIEKLDKKQNELSLEKEKNLNLEKEKNYLLEELNSIKNSRIYKLIKKFLKRK